MRPDSDPAPRTDRTAELELALIIDFLEQRGQTLHSLHTLREASLYASSRLSEVESRAQYVNDLHHT